VKHGHGLWAIGIGRGLGLMQCVQGGAEFGRGLVLSRRRSGFRPEIQCTYALAGFVVDFYAFHVGMI